MEMKPTCLTLPMSLPARLQQTIPALLLIFLAQPALASQTADQLMAGQTAPKASRLYRTSDPGAAADRDGFSATLLEDYVLVSLSGWSLTGEPLQASARLLVYEMLDTPAALGLYTLSRQELGAEARRLNWGFDAAAASDRLIFWHGNFFFSLRQPELDAEGWRAWIERLNGRIEHPTVYPMTVVQLPEEGLERDSIRFYLSDEALRTNRAFPAELLGAVGFEDRAEVTSARYRPSGRTLFLIGYPTATLAANRFEALQNQLQGVFSSVGIYMKRSGLLISLVEAPEPVAVALLDKVRYTATVQWIYEKDTSLEDRERMRGELITFFGIVTDSLLFVGFFVIVVLVCGMALGAIRYGMMERYPDWRSDDDMIRLDLNRAASRPDFLPQRRRER